MLNEQHGLLETRPAGLVRENGVDCDATDTGIIEAGLRTTSSDGNDHQAFRGQRPQYRGNENDSCNA